MSPALPLVHADLLVLELVLCNVQRRNERNQVSVLITTSPVIRAGRRADLGVVPGKGTLGSHEEG